MTHFWGSSFKIHKVYLLLLEGFFEKPFSKWEAYSWNMDPRNF